jgi:hypothetical protein
VSVLGINHLAFRTPDRSRGLGDPRLLRLRRPVGGGSDEIAFDVDAAGFDEVLARARRMGAVQREPVSPNAW